MYKIINKNVENAGTIYWDFQVGHAGVYGVSNLAIYSKYYNNNFGSFIVHIPVLDRSMRFTIK